MTDLLTHTVESQFSMFLCDARFAQISIFILRAGRDGHDFPRGHRGAHASTVIRTLVPDGRTLLCVHRYETNDTVGRPTS